MACTCGRSSISLSTLRLDHAILSALAALAALAAFAVLPGAVEATSDCVSFSTCRDCVQKPHCRWCTKIEGKPECMSKLDSRTCDGEDYKYEMEYENLTDKSSQINPKNAVLRLHVGTPYKMEIVFEKEDDYPVDLYYLMDLSNSMRDDKENLVRLGANLTTAMKQLTSNFRLGFGSFVDKVAMPFVNTAPVLLQNPCAQSTEICSPPYSFKNHMPLTKDTEKFSSHVRAANISGNVDYPEGGFDALMQAMVCIKEIGWRPAARHLLVMATDATFHLAGDGKLAGIVEPNDEQCHLNEEGDYTHYLEYDYPSISQIDRKARDKNINIFFAVTGDVINDYKSLSISTASSRTLSASSDNVVSLVTEQYKELVETVELEDNAKEKGVNIRYETRCQNATGSLRQSQKCQDVNAKKTPVRFYATVSVPSCPTYAKVIWEPVINIKVKGINESLELKLQVYCGCPCEQEGNMGYEENSAQCNGNGTLKCGICECKEGKSGQRCECDTGALEERKGDGACIAPNETEVCSGFGHCQCGACTCTRQDGQNFYGKFCECDDHSCARKNNKLCSGEERGECKCKRCVCKAGFTGEACEQSICGPDDTCYESPGGKLCSGFGDCECGMCKCNENRTGLFCEQCLTCPVIYCSKLKKCVESRVHDVGNDGQNPCEMENIFYSIVDVIEEGDLKKRQVCNFFDDAGCSFTFTYEKEDDTFYITAEKNKECPAPLDLLGIIFGVIGATVLLGLLIILLWKILTTIHDHREYAKFEKERALANWERGDNPLYIQATSTFSNPTFGN